MYTNLHKRKRGGWQQIDFINYLFGTVNVYLIRIELNDDKIVKTNSIK